MIMKTIRVVTALLAVTACDAMAWHTPCVSVSYGRAQRMAEKSMTKVNTPDGPRWVDNALVAELGDPMKMDANGILKMDTARRTLAETRGLDEDTIARLYNADGVGVAKVGDWIIGTVASGAAVYYGAKAVKGSDSSSKTKTVTTTTKTTDNHTTTTQYKIQTGDNSPVLIGNTGNTIVGSGVVGEAGAGGAVNAPATQAAP